MILKQKLNYSWNRKHKYNVNYVISDNRLNMAEACVYLCHQCTYWWLRWIQAKKFQCPIPIPMFSCLTRIMMQRWHVNSLGMFLVRPSRRSQCTPTIAHIRHWSDISHIMSQTMLGISRRDYSCWWLVAGYVCEVLQDGICHRYYVTAERHWQLEWVVVRYHARMHVSHVHCSPAQTETAFAVTVKRTHIGAHHLTNNADRR